MELAPGAREALDGLRGRLAVVAIITGRAPLDARAIAGDDEILVAGNHGLEWLEPHAAEPGVPESVAVRLGPADGIVRESLAAVQERLEELKGLVFEDKGPSGTIHYRLAVDPAAAREAILSALDETSAPAALDIREGRMAIELRPRGAGDKGSALRAIVERHRLRGLLVFGDDRTDADMFRAAAELRAAGDLAAFIGAVGTDAEVPDEVRDEADAVIQSPAALVELLRALG